MTPQEYCRQQAAQSGSSFYYSFLFLPPAQRDAITALYAFCRAVDDVVDNATDPGVAATKLSWWRGEVDRMAGLDSNILPSHPIAIALQAPAAQFGIKAVELKEIIAGMEMDLHQRSYVDDEALGVYCWRVAGVVGVLSARIFANGSDHLRDYASHMGQALQRINIIRDVGEDAQRGRVYVPVSLLSQHGLSVQYILDGVAKTSKNKGFQAVMADSAELARQHLALALKSLPAADIRAQRAGLIMARVYASLLLEIERSQYPVLSQRVSLTPLRKFSLAWRTWVAPQRAVAHLHALAAG